ncbi:MAG: hypothetical protein O2812_02330, partial [Chloroflexi bacterium]|nr:hypothetical protein [Chloroflexota bacterium]
MRSYQTQFATTTFWLLTLVVVVVLGLAACSSLDEAGFITYSTGPEGERDRAVVRPSGNQGQVIITDPADDFSPRWSADGNRLAFLSDRDGNVELYIASADGTNLMRSTNTDVPESDPTWSPDGRRVAYVSPDSQGNPHIFILQLATLTPQRLTFGSIGETDPVWSPNGRWLAYVGLNEDGEPEGIFIRNPDGVNRITVTSGLDGSPTWSPDSKWLAYVSEQGGNKDVYIITIESEDRVGTPIKLTDYDGLDFAPTWSPDSKRVAFLSDRNGNLDIFTIEADGENLQALTTNEVDELEVVWGPDGRLVFVSQLSDKPNLFIMKDNG